MKTISPIPNTAGFIDLTGHKYSRWLVSSYAGKHGRTHVWNCVCECGSERVCRGPNLRCGHSQSCGCYCADRIREEFTTHGRTRTPAYRAWLSMRDRCLRVKSSAFADYGGRGISICEAWETFQGFFGDMGDPPKGLTLERIDVKGNYNKQNCRWADRTDQARNRRNSRFIRIDGKNVHAKDAADILGVQYKTLMARINAYGWTDEEIVRGYKKYNTRKAS